MTHALLAAFHYLALGIGLGAIFVRARAFDRMRSAEQRASCVESILRADSAWGIAAALWLVTGLLRAFAGYEKESSWYLANHMFHLKMGLFILVCALEIYPLIEMIRWRIRQAQRKPIEVSASRLHLLARISLLQAGITCAIPLIASLMARGIGY